MGKRTCHEGIKDVGGERGLARVKGGGEAVQLVSRYEKLEERRENAALHRVGGVGGALASVC